jgi:hypothetical protein
MGFKKLIYPPAPFIIKDFINKVFTFIIKDFIIKDFIIKVFTFIIKGAKLS